MLEFAEHTDGGVINRNSGFATAVRRTAEPGLTDDRRRANRGTRENECKVVSKRAHVRTEQKICVGTRNRTGV